MPEYNIDAMLILAVETVTRTGSLALLTGDDVVSTVGDPGRSHSVRLPAEALAWLQTHHRCVDELDAIAVVTGPGSFTGLRVGLAAVQGFALSLGKRVVGVSTPDALLESWQRENPGASGVVAACLDGARNDVFFTAWDVTGAAGCEEARTIVPLQVGSPDVFAAAVRHLTPTVIGDASRRYGRELTAALPDASIDTSAVNLAAGAVRVALRRLADATAPHALRPIYVRRPDAELARDRVRAAAAAGFPIELSATAGDVRHAAALQARSFAEAWGVEAIEWELANLEAARLFVMRAPDGQVVGYCACWQVADELHINSVALDPAFRRRGLGRRLMEEVLRLSHATGSRAATLEVRESNTAARRLYERLGFKVEGVRRGYYDHPREDGLVLWRRDLAAR
jgi:tRNA threonylcarbamoyl adenosine modification protein YeaZ/ribosomal-protein-alanine acetyltransferase